MGVKAKEMKATDRPTARIGKLVGYALFLYNEETEHNNSQTVRMALKRFIPQKYFDEAAKLLNGANKSRKAAA